eukprot:CAMPEP_0181455668 /NCGR_PEP_ID=MMETSP1110-20121109/30875_1 /TAXON_ID=174948 /ORGANISM="Symbiodinium sp., Strain CCMP421" /LENGTH=36 /DNA_ID= /DNA_START= /DNA_END= /DNA_ORIENTATION=
MSPLRQLTGALDLSLQRPPTCSKRPSSMSMAPLPLE